MNPPLCSTIAHLHGGNTRQVEPPNNAVRICKGTIPAGRKYTVVELSFCSVISRTGRNVLDARCARYSNKRLQFRGARNAAIRCEIPVSTRTRSIVGTCQFFFDSCRTENSTKQSIVIVVKKLAPATQSLLFESQHGLECPQHAALRLHLIPAVARLNQSRAAGLPCTALQ
jgi:hypothetical protein